MRCLYGQCLFYRRVELSVEVLENGSPFHFAFGYLIEFFFYGSGKIVIEYIRKKLCQEVVHHCSGICGEEFPLFRTGGFRMAGFFHPIVFEGEHIEFALFAFFVSFLHILALLNGGDGRSIGRRTADAQFFERTYKACFGISCRALGETLRRNDGTRLKRLSLLQWRQQAAFVFLLVIVVMRFAVYTEESVELNHFSGSRKHIAIVADGYGSEIGRASCRERV